MTIAQNTAAITTDRAFPSNSFQSGFEFRGGFDELKIAPQLLANAHALEVPVSHLAEQDDGAFRRMLFCQESLLLDHQLQAFFKRPNGCIAACAFPLIQLAENPGIC